MNPTLASLDRAGADPALVFVHGLGCDRGDFAPQLERFAGRRLLAYDLRGHGRSARAERYDVGAHADDLARLIGERGLVRPVVVGHSFGGMIALELAARGTPELGAVVVVDAGMFLPAPFLAAVAPAFRAMMGPGGAAAWRQFLAGAAFGPAIDPARRDAILDRAGGVPDDVLAPNVAALLGFDAESAVRRCRAPLWYVAGVMPTDTARLLELCPSARVEAIGGGHFLQFEAPDRLNAVIARAVAELPRP